MPEKQGWETIVSFPGKVIMLPIRALLLLPEILGGFVYEGDLLNRSMDLLVADDSSRGLLPMWSSRYGAGLEYFHRDIGPRHSEADVSAQIGPLLRQRYSASYGVGIGRGLHTGLAGSYSRLPNENFFGIGNESNKADKTNYFLERSEFSAFMRSRRQQNSELLLEAGLEYNNIYDGKDDRFPTVGEKFDINEIPGYENRIELIWLEASFSHTEHNRPGSPTRGWDIKTWARIFGEIGDEEYEFFQAGADVETYLHLFYNRYLALRAAAQLSRPFKNRTVPFHHFSRIGVAEETIRGFERDRFMDRDLALGAIEYRWPIYHKIDALLFVQTGKVAHDLFDEFTTSTWHTSYGAGLRLWSQQGLLADLYVAKSRDGVRVHFSLNAY